MSHQAIRMLAAAALPLTLAAEPPAESTVNTEGQDMTDRTTDRKPNRLIDATSPYLLQHAYNPVDWHEWGPQAFQKAHDEGKPVFLSIGYSACHWCHVMEHESFENEDIARLLNEHFVSIKVDREERPDVDEIYMQVTVQMTGHGGWPMSVFLTPDKVPFFAGTYFPPEQFTQLISRIAEVWKENRNEITTQADQVRQYVQSWAVGVQPAEDVIGQDTIDQAAILLARHFDTTYGGISGGGTNKFPPSMAMELMLRVFDRTGDRSLLGPVRLTLDRMARGGIYDHLGGGICRYSTDVKWLVPHFEKMLYDQALVSDIYLQGQQVTGNRRYGAVAADIFRYVLSDLQSPEGGFYSARDADSEGLEGAYYIWTVEQVTEVLGEQDAELFNACYDVTPKGNWFESRGHAPEGPKNILHVAAPIEEFARKRGLDAEELSKRLAGMRKRLEEARSKRVEPSLDDKVLTGWNGLMIASLARGARVLDDPQYAEAAVRAADFVLDNMRKNGRLLRTYRGGQARLTGYLSDYAFMTAGLLNLYEATFELRWLREAVALTDASIEHYYDEQGGAFYFTADDAEEVLARTKSPRDGAIPSGNSVQAMNLLRLATLLNRPDYREKAESILRAFKPLAEQNLSSFERLLCAGDFYHSQPREIALAGDPASEATRELLKVVYDRYVPNKVVALTRGPDDPANALIPLLEGKAEADSTPTAFVCVNRVCRKPATDPEELATQLGRP